MPCTVLWIGYVLRWLVVTGDLTWCITVQIWNFQGKRNISSARIINFKLSFSKCGCKFAVDEYFVLFSFTFYMVSNKLLSFICIHKACNKETGQIFTGNCINISTRCENLSINNFQLCKNVELRKKCQLLTVTCIVNAG